MKNIHILSAALETVEEMLKEPLTVDNLANAVYCSASGLQKFFRYVLRSSVKEYITKRRLNNASKELLETKKSITEIAFDYQYESPEVFTRAFKRFWGLNPSEFRKTRRFSQLFPKFEYLINDGGNFMQVRKPVDISELYDLLKYLKSTYILSIDIKNFLLINEKYGYAAGDIVIAEVFHKIENAVSNDMLLFRTGGDEFAVVTKLTTIEETLTLAETITAQNGCEILTEKGGIPVSLRVGISKIPEGVLSYRKSLDLLTEAIENARKLQRDISILN